jgi:cysteine synthase
MMAPRLCLNETQLEGRFRRLCSGIVTRVIPTRRVTPNSSIRAHPTGIGQGRVTSNLKPDIHLLTGALHVPDSASINMVYRLLDEEGLYVGASSALNVWAAAELAKRKGKGSTVVTVLCDGAYR